MCEGEQRRDSRRGIEHDETGDEDVEVRIVECSDFAEGISSDENEGCPWEDSCNFPTLIVAMKLLE